MHVVFSMKLSMLSILKDILNDIDLFIVCSDRKALESSYTCEKGTYITDGIIRNASSVRTRTRDQCRESRCLCVKYLLGTENGMDIRIRPTHLRDMNLSTSLIRQLIRYIKLWNIEVFVTADVLPSEAKFLLTSNNVTLVCRLCLMGVLIYIFDNIVRRLN